MVANRAARSDGIDTVKVEEEAVEQGENGNDGEAPGRGERDAVTKVQQRGGDGTNDDAKLEPGEESTFGSEEDLGFYADGNVDA